MVISVALAELSRKLLFSDRIISNLSASRLTLGCMSDLPVHLKSLKGVYAHDLSLNCIHANWEEITPRIKELLHGNIVQ